jgi:hypothetical protein
MPRQILSVVLMPVLLAAATSAAAQAQAKDQRLYPHPAVQLKARPRPVEAPAVIHTVLQLRDGTQITGDVVSSAPGFIVVRTPSGQVRIVPRTEIARIDAARRERAAKVAGAIVRKSVTDLREPPKRGETRFGIFPLVQTGLTDHIAIGVTPLILPNGRAAIFVMGQLQIRQPNGTSYSAGLLHSEWFEHGRFGFAFGSVTKRTEHSSVTAGALVPYMRTEAGGGKLVFVRLGGSHTIGKAGYRVMADALASVRGGVITTTLGRATDGIAWSAGILTAIQDGEVKRIVPILNLGVRF